MKDSRVKEELGEGQRRRWRDGKVEGEGEGKRVREKEEPGRRGKGRTGTTAAAISYNCLN